MAKCTQAIRRLLLINVFIGFDHFVTIKGLIKELEAYIGSCQTLFERDLNTNLLNYSMEKPIAHNKDNFENSFYHFINSLLYFKLKKEQKKYCFNYYLARKTNK